MRIRYLIRLKKPVVLEDHWPVPLMGGELRFVINGGKATALEVIFTGQPISHAPTIEQNPAEKIKTTIVGRDNLLPFVQTHLTSAFSYVQCYFDVELLMDEVEAEYIAETDEEIKKIKINSMRVSNSEKIIPVSYDYFTRAIMAAEKNDGPNFEATLVSAARNSFYQKKYIDSFRYSFLLIESMYGGGKFKSTQLKDEFKNNVEFIDIVKQSLKEYVSSKRSRGSDTEAMLASSPTAEALIDHLVQKRGFYFHGNNRRKCSWKPHNQEDAEALCKITLEIAMQISYAASAPMFDAELSQRHYENAKKVGAIMTMNVRFRFREPDEKIERDGSINITVPGTKVTPRMAVYVAQEFFKHFEFGAPVAGLQSASCTVKETGQKVFDFNVHVDSAYHSPDDK